MRLSGFTLFEGNKGWQLSCRPAGESGWIVTHISEEQARDILHSIEPFAPTYDKPQQKKDLFGRPIITKRPRVHL